MSTVRFSAYPAAASLSALISGCSSWSKEPATHPFQSEFKPIDLVALLDPAGTTPLFSANGTTLDEGQRIDLAFQRYHAISDGKPPEAQAAARDQIQERLIGASNQLCLEYQQQMASREFNAGALAPTDAGELLSGGAPQSLTGIVASTSGLRAEFNQDYLHAQLLAIVFEGIQSRRQTDYEGILQKRQPQGGEEYSIEMAVKDAIAYHADCSLGAGMQELSASVKIAKDPGLDQLVKAFLKVDRLRDAMNQGERNVADDPDDPLGAIEPVMMSVGDTLRDFMDQLGHIGRWPPGDAYSDAFFLKAAARLQMAMDQLAQCHDRAVEWAIATAPARSDLAKAKDEADKAAKQAALEIRLREGRPLAREMRGVGTSIRNDLKWLLGRVEAAEISAATTHSATMQAAVLDQTLRDFEKWALAPRPACVTK
ncbi:hypothetical protein [Dongia sp. agr-C8]